ncbi:MAG: TIM-barrel domain-containing protein [Terriglobia bacterium]
MKSGLSRRQAVSLLGAASADFALAQLPLHGRQAEAQTGTLAVAGQRAELQITAVTSHTLRISVLAVSEQGDAQPVPESIVLARREWPAPLATMRSASGAKRLRWQNRSIGISAAPLRVTITSKPRSIVQQIAIDAGSGAMRFEARSQPFFGLGEGGPQFDRRGADYPLKHGEGVPHMRTDGACVPIPWLMGAGGWGLFFHLPLGTIDLTQKEGVFQARPGEAPLPLDLFLAVADEPRQLLREYAQLTGFPHMPPIWALGYQQSHRTLTSRDDVLAEPASFRRKQLPCDVMIYLGTGFCPSGWNAGHGSYEFNPRVFPDPAPMIGEMHRKHFRVVLHEDKPPRSLHGRAGDKGAAANDPEDAANYWQKHVKVFDLGVDGWWADEGDWLDDISCLVRNRMYWEGAQLARPNVRPYTLNRNGYAGIQRYGWLWSGDISSRWRTLREQIAVGLNTGLSGMPYWGTDTGGFATTPELTGELYVRWFQFSAFCPLFRSHGRTWQLRLPWGWNTGSYGPIESPKDSLPPVEDLHDARVEPICRKVLDLRYRLLPYLYTIVREAHDTGVPVMRALWIHYPQDARAAEQSDEFLFGPDLLIAPVTEQAAQSRKVYLPRGSWYDYWTEERVEGGRDVVRPVSLETIPIYVKGGTILPLGPVKQFTTEESAQAETLIAFTGADGSAEIYEDDGTTFDFRRGAFSRTRLAWEEKSRRLSVSLVSSGRPYHARRFEVRVAAESRTRAVTFDGQPLTLDL